MTGASDPAPINRLGDFWLSGRKGRLHPAEKGLLDAVSRGVAFELAPARPVRREKANFIRTRFLAFLARGGGEGAPVTDKGIEVTGAWIGTDAPDASLAQLDLAGAGLKRNLLLRACTIDDPIDMRGAEFETVGLEGTHISDLTGDGLKAGQILMRDGFQATGTVRLLLAEVRGDFDCRSGTFAAADTALNCDRVKVSGNVFLRNGFTAAGQVRLQGAEIGGDLVCADARFQAPERSLQGAGLTVGGYIYFCDGFKAEGLVALKGVSLTGNLDCRGGRFNGPKASLKCESAAIGRDILISEGFAAAGEVSFARARIGGAIVAMGAQLAADSQSLNLRRCEIGADVYLTNGFSSAGMAGSVAASATMAIRARPNVRQYGTT